MTHKYRNKPAWKSSKVVQKVYALCREYYQKVPGDEFKEILYKYLNGKMNAVAKSTRRRRAKEQIEAEQTIFDIDHMSMKDD